MIEKSAKIGHRETLILLIVIMSAKVFLSFPRNMALVGDSAGWLVILLSGIFSLIGYFLIYSLIRKYPSDNIFEVSRRLTGNFFGICLNILIFVYFLVITSLFIRQFSESFILAILPRTPISVLTIIFLALVIYSALLGIETISRLACFLGPYLLIGLIAIVVFSKPTGVQSLFPLLGPGPIPVLKQSVLQISNFSEFLLLAIIAPLIRKKETISKIGFLSIAISTLILTGLTAIVIMTFNYTATSSLVFPIFQLTRLISLGQFIQRVESVFVFVWFLTAGIAISGLFYGTTVSFSETFKIKNYRPLVFPLAILVFILSLIPQSMSDTVHLDNFVISKYYSLIWIGIPLILWLLSLIIKKEAGAVK